MELRRDRVLAMGFIVLMFICIISNVKGQSEDSSCSAGGVLQGMSLRGSSSNTNATRFSGVADMDGCIKRCCESPMCDLAMMVNNECHGVDCKESATACQLEHSNDLQSSSAVAFVTKFDEDENAQEEAQTLSQRQDGDPSDVQFQSANPQSVTEKSIDNDQADDTFRKLRPQPVRYKAQPTPRPSQANFAPKSDNVAAETTDTDQDEDSGSSAEDIKGNGDASGSDWIENSSSDDNSNAYISPTITPKPSAWIDNSINSSVSTAQYPKSDQSTAQSSDSQTSLQQTGKTVGNSQNKLNSNLLNNSKVDSNVVSDISGDGDSDDDNNDENVDAPEENASGNNINTNDASMMNSTDSAKVGNVTSYKWKGVRGGRTYRVHPAKEAQVFNSNGSTSAEMYLSYEEHPVQKASNAEVNGHDSPSGDGSGSGKDDDTSGDSDSESLITQSDNGNATVTTQTTVSTSRRSTIPSSFSFKSTPALWKDPSKRSHVVGKYFTTEVNDKEVETIAHKLKELQHDLQKKGEVKDLVKTAPEGTFSVDSTSLNDVKIDADIDNIQVKSEPSDKEDQKKKDPPLTEGEKFKNQSSNSKEEPGKDPPPKEIHQPNKENVDEKNDSYQSNFKETAEHNEQSHSLDEDEHKSDRAHSDNKLINDKINQNNSTGLSKQNETNSGNKTKPDNTEVKIIPSDDAIKANEQQTKVLKPLSTAESLDLASKKLRDMEKQKLDNKISNEIAPKAASKTLKKTVIKTLTKKHHKSLESATQSSSSVKHEIPYKKAHSKASKKSTTYIKHNSTSPMLDLKKATEVKHAVNGSTTFEKNASKKSKKFKAHIKQKPKNAPKKSIPNVKLNMKSNAPNAQNTTMNQSKPLSPAVTKSAASVKSENLNLKQKENHNKKAMAKLKKPSVYKVKAQKSLSLKVESKNFNSTLKSSFSKSIPDKVANSELVKGALSIKKSVEKDVVTKLLQFIEKKAAPAASKPLTKNSVERKIPEIKKNSFAMTKKGSSTQFAAKNIKANHTTENMQSKLKSPKSVGGKKKSLKRKPLLKNARPKKVLPNKVEKMVFKHSNGTIQKPKFANAIKSQPASSPEKSKIKESQSTKRTKHVVTKTDLGPLHKPIGFTETYVPPESGLAWNDPRFKGIQGPPPVGSKKASKCERGVTVKSATLRGGILAGEFHKMGLVADIDACADVCCKNQRCDIAMLLGNECVNVKCFSSKLCKLAPATRIFSSVTPIVTFVRTPGGVLGSTSNAETRSSDARHLSVESLFG